MKKVFVLAASVLAVCLCFAQTRTVDALIPAGNIILESIDGDTVYVHQDLRDTSGDWFYWGFRACGFQGRTVTFVFTKSVAVGVRGPVISLDQGRTYGYADVNDLTRNKFTYSFPEDASEVWMYECFPYLPDRWEAFVRSIPAGIKYEAGTLCRSPKGADVPYLHIGEGKYKVVLTSRHHCSETPGTFVLEGIAAAFAEESRLGRMLRKYVDLTIVPFADYDGAVAGDQGKNRYPHDHNRDYTEFLYPETKAIAVLMEEAAPSMCLDIHAPWLYGDSNEFIYTPMKDPSSVRDVGKEALFSYLLEKNQEGGLRYRADDDLPFGLGWNTSSNFSAGASFIIWSLMNIPSLEVGRSIEVPFANANGAVVTPVSLMEFGHGIARTILQFATM